MAKQTAGNNEFLMDVKDAMNKPTYIKTLHIYNNQCEEAAIEYLAKFFKDGTDTQATIKRMAETTRKFR